MFEAAGNLRASCKALFSSYQRKAATVGTSRGSHHVGYLVAAIVGLHVVLICPAAKADVIDCLQVVTTGLAEAAKAVQLGECADRAADPTPKFAAMLFLVGSAMANGWLPDDANGCKSAIWGIAGKLLSKMLEIVPIPALEGVKGDLAAMGQAQLKQLMYSNPALKEIAELFDCACDVVAFGKSALNNVLNEAKGCGQVVADAVNFFGSALSSWGDGFAEMPCNLSFGLCGSSNPTTPICWGAKCALGQQCYQWGVNSSAEKDKGIATVDHNPSNYCAPCSRINYAISTKKAGLCACPHNFIGDYYNLYGQLLLKSCTCPSPFSAVWQQTPFGLTWDCRCPDGKVLTPSYECKLFCGPNQRAASKTVTAEITKITLSPGSLLPKTDIEHLSKQQWHCETCPLGEQSDGVSACIPCAGKKSFVANGTCQSCKAWQKVHLAMAHLGGSRCEDICPNGIYQPAVLPNIPEQETVAKPPGKKKETDPTASVVTQPVPVPPDGTSPPTGEVLLAKQDCKPCEGNAFALNNKCHACGDKAIADIFARACKPCDGKQVARHIAGAWMCVADCSKVGGGGNVRPSINYIADPDNTAKCIPCGKGSKSNADHTACISSARISAREPARAEPAEPSLPLADGKPSKRVKPTDVWTQKATRVACPPGTHRSPRGQGCVPNIRLPNTGKIFGIAPPGLPGGRAPTQSRRLR